MHVLPLGDLRREKLAQGGAILRSWFSPVSLDRIPSLAEALLISVSVLRNDRGDALRVRQCESQSNWRTVVEDEECIAMETDSVGEVVDDLSKVVKRVPESLS